MAKKNELVNLDGIDAESIIHSFRTTDHLQMVKDAKDVGSEKDKDVKDSQQTQEMETPAMINPESLKEENRRRRGKPQDYESLFIREAGGITAREGKTVYIRKQYHDRILKIVRVIGGNDLSLFSYLDNVLEHHFALFQQEITTLYNKKNEGIF
ncbi:MAG: DUF3408 domain-containing protein [Lentimicrobiaceae bacterium]|nr:DUF3408 domain-containing protein [Lentimicrobiaceae bacterium]